MQWFSVEYCRMESYSDSCEEFDIEHYETDLTSLALSSSSGSDNENHLLNDEWTEINIKTDIPAAPTSCFAIGMAMSIF